MTAAISTRRAADRGTVLRLGILTLPDDPPLVVNVCCLPGLPSADVGQAFVKRLGIVPDELDCPLAAAVYIAVLPSGLVAICRHKREPIGERLGEGHARWKFGGHGARFIDEHPASLQLNRSKPLGKLASLN